jgi:hypothetical protein
MMKHLMHKMIIFIFFVNEEVLLEECYAKYFYDKEWLPTKIAFLCE